MMMLLSRSKRFVLATLAFSMYQCSVRGARSGLNSLQILMDERDRPMVQIILPAELMPANASPAAPCMRLYRTELTSMQSVTSTALVVVREVLVNTHTAVHHEPQCCWMMVQQQRRAYR